MSDPTKKSRHRDPLGICSSCEKATSDIHVNRLRTNTRPTIATAAMTVFALMSGAGLSAQSAIEPGKVLRGKAAFGDWREDAPGIRRLITLADLPEIAPEEPNLVELAPKPADAMPHVPDGFTVEVVSTGLAQARVIHVAPNGDIFVTNSSAGEVRVYRIPSGSSTPKGTEIFASGLHQPYGMAFYPPGPDPQWLYVANSNGVVRFPYKNGDLKTAAKAQQIVDCIPPTHHWIRDILFTPDGKRLLLAVGSGSNAALDMFPFPLVPGGMDGWNKTHPLGSTWDTEEGRANILSFNPDGSDQKILATGMRNPSGITIQPATGELWAVINERDGLGDNTPFEYATHVQTGAFYGWPWYFLGDHEDPRHKGEHTDLKDKITIPDVFMQTHSAPLQIEFYEGDNFPAEYKGSAFVTLHGSWDRSRRTGYKVVRLIFDKNGKATGEYDDFMTGFVISDKQVWGRPVGVATAKDGSLFVTDDGTGTIWRISYKKPTRN
jgi:glucose/arabinose dehydrogenase